jgi:hypothetical protein
MLENLIMNGVLCPSLDSANTWCYASCPVGFAPNVATGETEGSGLKQKTATVFHRVEWTARDETATYRDVISLLHPQPIRTDERRYFLISDLFSSL